jgi:hypothetical protein
MHPIRDWIAEGTTADAAWVGAKDATAGLFASRSFVVEAIDFKEIGGSLRG